MTFFIRGLMGRIGAGVLVDTLGLVVVAPPLRLPLGQVDQLTLRLEVGVTETETGIGTVTGTVGIVEIGKVVTKTLRPPLRPKPQPHPRKEGRNPTLVNPPLHQPMRTRSPFWWTSPNSYQVEMMTASSWTNQNAN